MRNAAFIRKCGTVILLLVGIAFCFAWTVERTSFADSSNKKAAGSQAGAPAVRSDARSIATADFDGDAAPDVIIGYAAEDGTGIIDIRRGNPDAFAPTDDSVFVRVQKGYNPEALLNDVRTLYSPEPVDLIAAGNFDDDTNKDIIAASLGGRRLLLFKGNGKGNFAAPKEIDLAGTVTALRTGEFRAADGRDDVVVGTGGSRLLVFDGANGGVGASPMEIAIPGEITTVHLGAMDHDPFIDIIAATESEIYILHGWGRKSSPAVESQLELIATDIGVREMIVGHFVWDREGKLEIAAASGDGIVKILGQRALKTEPFSEKEMIERSSLRSSALAGKRNVDVEAVTSWSIQDRLGWVGLRTADASQMSATAKGSLLATTNLFYRETHDVLVAGDRKVSILRQVTSDVAAPRLPAENAIDTTGDMDGFSVSDSGGAVSAVLQLQQKINGERNLIILREKSTELEMVPLVPTNITVDRTDDPSGAALAAASVCGAGGGDCSLRGAFQFANLAANSPATINLPAGTYILSTNGNTTNGCGPNGNPTGDLGANLSTNIVGAGAATTIIRQTGTGPANDGDRVMCMNENFLLNLIYQFSGVTFTGGRDGVSGGVGPDVFGGGGIIGGEKDNSLTLTSVVFVNNQVTQTGLGGGGLQLTGGNLIITNSTFGGSAAPGLYTDRASVTAANSCRTSGGGFVYTPTAPAHTPSNGTATVTGSTFSRNVSVSAGSGGGGADLVTFAFAAPGGTGTGSASISTSTFSNNQAQSTGSGGGILVESLATTVATTSLTNNSAGNRGGGIFVGGASLLLDGTTNGITFSGNTATSGGTSVSTSSAVNVAGTNTTIGGSIEVNTLGSWTNNVGSTLAPTDVVVTGGTFNMNNSTMNVSGNMTIGPGPVVGSTFNGGTGTVNIQGNFVLNAGGTPATTLNAGTGTFNFNGAGSQSITNGTLITFFNLTDSNTTQPLTLNNSFNVNGSLNVNGASAVLAPVAASVIGGTGTLTGNGTARVTRIAATAGFLNQYTITNKTLTNLLVDYVGAGAAQVLSAFTYGPLRINNANGVASAAGTATVNGLLTLQSGALNVGTSTLVINNGTSVGAGSLTSAATGTVNYNQASGGQAVIAGTYGNLTFSNFSKVLASAGTIGIAGTFTPGSAIGHTVTGSTINFNGTGAQTVPAFQYNNLSISGVRGVNNVTLANGGIVAILGVFNPTATFAGGNYIVTNNTVDFNGTGSQTIPAFNYNNLTSSSTGARTLANAGTIGVAGTFAPGTNVYTITGSTINFNGAGPQTIPAFNYNSLTSSNAGARTLAGAGVIGIAGVFTPGANVYTILGSTVDFNGGVAQTIPAFNYNHLTSSNSGARTLANAGTIGVFGNFTPGSNVYTITGSTINFNGTGSQNIPAFGYNNLTSSSTGSRTLANTGIIGVAGAFTPGTNAYTTTGSTITYNGAAQSVAVFPYNNLSTAGSGIKSLTGATTVGGALSIGVGTTLDVTASNFALNVAGNWTNNGAFTQRSGTVTLNGSSQQTIGGTSATTFNNLIVNNPSGVLASLNVTVNGLLTLTAGTFNIGTNTLTLNNGTSVGAGALNGASGTTSYNQASPGQIVLAGNYNNLTFSNFDKILPNGGTIGISGVFTPGTAVGHTITNSTIDFNGIGAQTIPAFNYFHLTSSNSGARTLAPSGTIGIAGLFTPGTNAYTITGSTINFNGSGAQTIPAFNYNNLTSSNTGARTLPSSGVVGIAGTFTPGTNAYTIVDSTVEYNGSLLQTLPAGFPTYNNLRINNPAGANLAGNTTVNGVLTLISGEINTGAFTLTIGSNGSVTRTSGHVVGTVDKLFSGPGPQFIFPVGTAGQYSPVDVTVMSGSGSLSVRANAGTAPAIPPLEPTRMLQRYWSLNGSGITSNVVFHYLNGAPPAGDIPVTSTESAYHIFRVLGTGQAVPSPPDGIGILLDTVNDTFTVIGMNQYSHWTAGNPLAPTAANVNVSGRVVDANGRGVPSAHVMMQDQAGNVLWATTNPFGYYRFAGVPAGQTYMFSPRHKRYEFQSRAVTINEDLTGLDFIAKP